LTLQRENAMVGRRLLAIGPSDKGLGGVVSTLTWNVISGLVALAILALILATLLPRRDRRFATVDPGKIPADARRAPTFAVPADDTVAASNQAPAIAPLEAGLLLTGKTLPEHVTATAVAMAARGILKFRATTPPTIKLVAPREASDPYERAIVEAYTAADASEGPVDQAALLKRLTALADDSAEQNEWFLRRNHPLNATLSRIGIVLVLAMVAVIVVYIVASLVDRDFFTASLPVLTWIYTHVWPLLVLIIVVLAVYSTGLMSRTDQTQRSALGRALTDQCLAFTAYIAGPKIVDFTNDKDAFLTYLPWAVLAGKVAPWMRACSLIPNSPAPAAQVKELYVQGAEPEGVTADGLEALNLIFQP
jgi:hypothetical protein